MMSEMTPQEIEQFRMLLRQRRRELSADSAAGAKGDGNDFDESNLGRLSRMDALQCHAMEEESRRRRAVELVRIERKPDLRAIRQALEEGRIGEDVAVLGERKWTLRIS